MDVRDLDALVDSWVEEVRGAFAAQDIEFIPCVGDLCLDTPWDDDFQLLIAQWSPKVRQNLLEAFANRGSYGEVHVACRYTALQTYSKLLRYLIDIKGDLPTEIIGNVISLDGNSEPIDCMSISAQVTEDLRFLVDAVRVQDLTDWRMIRWEIMNSCLLDQWERVFQLFDHAELLEVANDRDLCLMRGQLRFFVATFALVKLSKVQESIRNTCYLRKAEHPLHPLNWEPRVYDSQAIPLSLFLFACGLTNEPSGRELRDDEEELLRLAVADLERATKAGVLPPPYLALLVCSRRLLGADMEAIKDCEDLLEITEQDPWAMFRVQAYRTLAACYEKIANPKKAIQVLITGVGEFPEEKALYLKIAELQARDTDFLGVVETLRQAEGIVSDIADDWRVSSLLAIRGMENTTNWNIHDDIIQRYLGAHPAVGNLMERMCDAYWPPFKLLSDPAKEAWKMAILEGHWFSALEPTARAPLEGSAVRAFALAAEIELQKRIFDEFRLIVSQNPMLLKAASSATNPSGGRDTFLRFLTHGRFLSLGDMQTALKASVTSENPVFISFSSWLRDGHPRILDITSELHTVARIRNRASHEGLAGATIEEVHRLCRDIIQAIHPISFQSGDAQ